MSDIHIDFCALFIARINNIISLTPLSPSEIWGEGWEELSQNVQEHLGEFAFSLAEMDGRCLRGVHYEDEALLRNRYLVNAHLLKLLSSTGAHAEVAR